MNVSLEIESVEKLVTEIEEQKEYLSNFWKGNEAKAFLEKYEMMCKSLKENVRSLNVYYE